MAVKPLTVPRIWANLTNYDNGPFVGSPMKVVPSLAIANSGHRPGAADPTAAEHENSQQNKITDWVTNWLSLGSFAGASDAHIVETTATGRTGLTGLDVNNVIGESGVISITNGGTLPAFFGRNENGPVFRAITINGNGPAFRSDLAAAGQGLLVNMAAASTGNGVHVVMTSGGATAKGIHVEQTGDGSAIFSTSNSDQVGVELKNTKAVGGGALLVSALGGTAAATITATTAAAVEATGEGAYTMRVQNTGGGGAIRALLNSGSGTAVEGLAASGYAGYFFSLAQTSLKAENVNGFNAFDAESDSGLATMLAVNNSTGHGIRATSNSGAAVNGIASTSGRGGEFLSNSGAAVYGFAISGFAAQFNSDTTSPVNGTILCVPVNLRPTNNQDGQLTFVAGLENQYVVSSNADGFHRGVWSSRGGYCQAYAAQAVQAIGGGVFENLPNIVLSGGNAPKVASRPVTLRVMVHGQKSSGLVTTLETLQIRLRDVTANALVASWFQGDTTPVFTHIYGSNAGGTYEPVACIQTTITPPAAGARTYRFEVASTTANQITLFLNIEFLGQN